MPIAPLSDLPRYLYGTTRLGDDSIPLEQRVEMAGLGVAATGWIHTSHQYGDALTVLRAALDRDRSHLQGAVFKIGWDDPAQIREQVELQIEALEMKSMPIGQLCLGENLSRELVEGGSNIEPLQEMKRSGLVGRYVMEVFPWTSARPLQALQAGRALDLVDGLIFYLNPLQRFVINELWDFVVAHDVPVIAMRTVCGGNVHAMRDNPNSPDWLRLRAGQVAPLFDRSGCSSWTEFCVRFALAIPQVRATVGATSKPENLQLLLGALADVKPLPGDIQDEIFTLQREWSDAHDRHAEPWSM